MAKKRRKLGEILYKAGVVKKEPLIKAIKVSKTSNKKLGQVLLEKGLVDEETHTNLTELEVSQRAEIRRVTAQDPAMLQYLSSVGLTPDKTITVMDKGLFEGPLTLLIDGDQRVIGWKVAREVQVVAL